MRSSRNSVLFIIPFIAVMFTIGLTTSYTAWAVPDVSVVSLRADCGTDPNCFNNITDLNNWLSGTRKPSASKRTLVNIGAGTFIGAITLNCDAVVTTGYVSFKGAGREVTTISNSNASSMAFTNCDSITVQDLKTNSTTQHGVLWTGVGSSNWTNVGIVGLIKAWQSAADSAGTSCVLGAGQGRHNFFSVIMEVNASSQSSGIYNACGDLWLWGSEISVVANVFSSSGALTGIVAKGTGNEVHLYGSNVSVTSTTNAAATTPSGLVTQAGGVIHFHGGEVVVRYSNTAVNVSVVGASADGTGSLVHTIETSYGLGATGSGMATRVAATNSGSVQSVFQWPAAGNPPMGGGGTHLKSLNGQDSYVENDCPLATKCLATPGSGDKYPHLMIFSDACTGTSPETGPWFDTITNKCRGI